MIKRGKHHAGGHVSDIDLVLFLDGELDADRGRRVASHLDACWSCRSRRGKVEAAIAAAVAARNTALAGAVPPKGWREFELRLEQVAAANSAPRRWMPSGLQLKAASVLVAMAGLFAWLNSGVIHTVSAKELLLRAENAGSAGLQEVREPVLHQKLRIRRRSAPGHESGIVESWHDLRQRRTAWRGAQQEWQELRRVLQTNGLDPQSPLSPGAYRRWMERTALASRTVRNTRLAGGAPAYALKSVAAGPVPSGGIAENELVVRAADWRPVSGTLRVRAEDSWLEYNVAEVSYEVIARNAVAPHIFDDAARPQPPAMQIPAAPAIAPVTPAQYLEPRAEPWRYEAAEMEARYALHRQGACLTGTVQVVRRSPRQVAVTGFVGSAREKQELAAALAGAPLVSVEVQSLEDMAAAERPLPVAGPAAVEITARQEDRAQRNSPVEEHLLRYFAQRYGASNAAGRVAEFADEVISLHQSIRKDAWALRRLAERYGPVKLADLPPSSRRLLDAMVREHMRVLQAEMRHSEDLLEPALAGFYTPAPGLGAEPDGPGEPSWSSACLAVVTVAERTSNLVESIFAGTAQEDDAARVAALLNGFTRLRSRFDTLERSAASQILSRGSLASSDFWKE